MSTIAKHDPDADYEPAFAAPKGACDAHFHVFGREEQYPYYALDLRYKPPYEPLEAYMKLARRLGLERFVFVQPSAYGFDNSCMLDAMREVGAKKCFVRPQLVRQRRSPAPTLQPFVRPWLR